MLPTHPLPGLPRMLLLCCISRLSPMTTLCCCLTSCECRGSARGGKRACTGDLSRARVVRSIGSSCTSCRWCSILSAWRIILEMATLQGILTGGCSLTASPRVDIPGWEGWLKKAVLDRRRLQLASRLACTMLPFLYRAPVGCLLHRCDDVVLSFATHDEGNQT
jgi:hypothetical protein